MAILRVLSLCTTANTRLDLGGLLRVAMSCITADIKTSLARSPDENVLPCQFEDTATTSILVPTNVVPSEEASEASSWAATPTRSRDDRQISSMTRESCLALATGAIAQSCNWLRTNCSTSTCHLVPALAQLNDLRRAESFWRYVRIIHAGLFMP